MGLTLQQLWYILHSIFYCLVTTITITTSQHENNQHHACSDYAVRPFL